MRTATCFVPKSCGRENRVVDRAGASSAAAFRSVAAFVPQDDCFLPHLRTWEALYFVARLKLEHEDALEAMKVPMAEAELVRCLQSWWA